MPSLSPPTLLVSRCLRGVACRYDGASRPCPGLDLLPAAWILLDVCPEEDVGMGVPRPPIVLLQEERLRLVDRNGRDWTHEMESWCRDFARILLKDGAAGAVLKARSPSCGVGDVEVFGQRAALAWPGAPGRAVQAGADGFWVQALKACEPSFPLINDEELLDPARRACFLQAVERRHRLRPPPSR